MGARPRRRLPADRYGLYDTTGNVWEWVSDLYSDTYYADSPHDNPLGPEVDSDSRFSPLVRWQDGDHLRLDPEAYRVIRGGAWNNEQFGLRCCERIFARAGTHHKSLVSGFHAAAGLLQRGR